MCGIAGIITPYNDKRDRTRLAEVLLHDIDIRGGDSCGVYVGGRIIKEPVRAYEFPLPTIRGSCIMHTRMATHGGVTRKNAHPFRRGRTVGVHNGICSNYHELLPGAQVDSVAVIDAIDKYGVPIAYSRMRGTFATATVSHGVTTLARAGNPCYVYRAGDTHVFSSHPVGLWLHLISDEVERVPLDDNHMIEFVNGRASMQKPIKTLGYVSHWTGWNYKNGVTYVPAKKVQKDCVVCDEPGAYDADLECHVCDSCYSGLKTAGSISVLSDDQPEYWECG